LLGDSHNHHICRGICQNLPFHILKKDAAPGVEIVQGLHDGEEKGVRSAGDFVLVVLRQVVVLVAEVPTLLGDDEGDEVRPASTPRLLIDRPEERAVVEGDRDRIATVGGNPVLDELAVGIPTGADLLARVRGQMDDLATVVRVVRVIADDELHGSIPFMIYKIRGVIALLRGLYNAVAAPSRMVLVFGTSYFITEFIIFIHDFFILISVFS